jgi:hypothetical protein
MMTQSIFPYGATACLAVALLFSASSCASAPPVQPRVNSLVYAQKLESASAALGDNPAVYGKNNALLYWLDRGMVEHCLGRYSDSIRSFASAQRIFDQLYTKSISKLASAWALNDYAAPYRGDDYEYTLINIFQAMNYVMLGDTNEALVEARDMNSKLNLLNALYKGKNVYKEDAFGRFLMGILYEVNGTQQDLNDAFISYAKAYDIYKAEGGENFEVKTPGLLKENLLTIANFMGTAEFSKYRREFPDVRFSTLKEKAAKAEVYLVQYTGFSPVKISGIIPVPFDPRHVTQVVFPKFISRYSEIGLSEFSAQRNDQLAFVQPAFVGQDIEAIARKVLDSRKVQIFAKAVIRPVIKYAAERALSEEIEDKWGENAAYGFNFLSSLYNLSTERADLRSWQTLPAAIRLARLIVEPGDYEFFVQTYTEDGQALNKVSLGEGSLKAGQKKFFVFRNYR